MPCTHFFTRQLFIALAVLFSCNLSAQGFEDSHITWDLPPGGAISSEGDEVGYYYIFSVNSEDNSENWDLMDMNGDGIPDLVLTGEGNGDWPVDFGTPSNPYWKVYLGEGDGFATSFIEWNLPSGGAISSTGVALGFYELYRGRDNKDGSQAWSVIHMNGDLLPDLAVTSEGNGTNAIDFGTTASPYWKVFINEGDGFADTEITWDLPQEGAVTSSGTFLGYNALFNGPDSFDESETWGVIDMDADGKPDLVVTAEGNGSFPYDLGTAASPYWKVYLNIGSGFDTEATLWYTPAGGRTTSTGILLGFNNIIGIGSSYDSDQGWNLIDMDGDAKPELIVTGEGNGDYFYDLGTASNPYWKVFKNLGDSFEETAINWYTPSGGARASDGEFLGFNLLNGVSNYFDGNNGWSTLDMNGDKLPDLVVTCEGDGDYAQEFGTASSAYWKVYYNEGDAFADTYFEWSVPDGGTVVSDGTELGFVSTSGNSTYLLNCESYVTRDMDGDKMPDLVVPGKGDGNYPYDFGTAASPYWKVFLNTSPDIIEVNIEENLPQLFSIQPNPAHDWIQISNYAQSFDVQYQLFNLQGVCLQSGNLKNVSLKIDISEYPSGTFVLRVGNEVGVVVKH